MAGRTIYQIEIRHPELNKYRLIRGTDSYVVQQKAEAQQAAWAEMWAKKQAAQERTSAKEEMKQLAEARTREAQAAQQRIENLLKESLHGRLEIDWEELKDRSPYQVPVPEKPQPGAIPPEPVPENSEYKANLNILDWFSSARRQRKIDAAAKLFRQDHDTWLSLRKEREKEGDAALVAHEKSIRKWERAKERFLKEQEAKNNGIEEQKKAYLAKSPDAVIDYCERVLSGSKYPDEFPQEYDIDYKPDTQTLLLDYLLPSMEHIPRLKEVKYIASKNELREVFIAESAHQNLFDAALYQIAIRTLRELFEADAAKAIEAIALNGWVHAVDKGTGQEIKVCLLSAYVSRGEFGSMYLIVYPKNWTGD